MLSFVLGDSDEDAGSMRVPLPLLATALAIAGCAGEDRGQLDPSASRWLTTRQSCSVWDPRPRPGETADWTGACAGGFTEGRGTLTWRSPQASANSPNPKIATTSTYEGGMREGKEAGDGVLTFFDTATGEARLTMVGHFVAGTLEGRGTAAAENGYRFTGEFRSGRRNGQGLAHYANGATYEGMFRDNWPEGHGNVIGQSSIGFLRGAHGDIDGSHQIISPGGYRFEGVFERGQPEGIGMLVLSGPAAPTQPRWTLGGEWIDGCLSDGTRQACLGPGKDRAPELALLPVSHPAIAKGWAGRPISPADAHGGLNLAGQVAVDCYVTVSGVADNCDVGESTDHRLDRAAVTFAMNIPWIPAATKDGGPIDDPHAAYAVTFSTGAASAR